MRPARVALGGIAGAAALIAAVTVLSRIVGFARWVVFDHAVGNACVGSIYAGANQVPNVLYEVVAGGALAAAVVPVLAPMIDVDRAGDVRRTVGALFTWACLLTVPVSLLLVALAGPLASWLTPGRCAAAQPDAAQSLTTWMLRVFAVQVVFYAVGSVASSVLQAHRRFLAPALAPLLSSLMVVFSYLAVGATVGTHRGDPAGLPDPARNWLGWGTTVGVLALSLPLLLPLVRSVPGVRPTLRFPPGVARAVAAQAGGGVAALLAQQVFVVTYLGLFSRPDAVEGTVNLFQYTQAVYLLPFAVLVVPLATSTFPALSAAHRDPERFSALSARTLRVTLGVSLAGAVALIGAAPALEVFFSLLDGAGHGAPGLAGAVVLMAVGLPGYAVLTAASRALQARRRPRPAAAGTSLAWLGAAATAMVAVTAGVTPLTAVALGSCLGMTVGAVYLVSALRRDAGASAATGLARMGVSAGPAAALLAAAGWRACRAGMVSRPSLPQAVAEGAVLGGAAAGFTLVIVAMFEPGIKQALRRGGGR